MIIRVKKSWKDWVEKDPNHPRFTRRDFIQAGLATSVLSVGLPGALIRNAMADASACPAQVRNLGGLGQWWADGGPTIYSWLLSDQAAGILASSASAQGNYGLVGTDLVSVGTNMNVSKTHPFGQTLLLGPPGTTVAAWAAVLKKCSMAVTAPVFLNDDGGQPDNQKLAAGVGKHSATKDITSGNNTPWSWAAGTPTSNVRNLSVTGLESTFTVTPAGKTNLTTVTNAANASQALTSLFAGGMFGSVGRKGFTNFANGQSCGFFSMAPTTSPTYAASLFDPTQNPKLVGLTTGLSTTEAALVGAYGASAQGIAGSVNVQDGGNDYHGQTATTIGDKDIVAARALVMFIAACDAIGSKGAWILGANGSAVAAGSTANTTLNVGGNAGGVTTINATVPNASGDAAGFGNIGAVIFYDPAGSPPSTVKSLPKIANDGSMSIDSAAGVTTMLDATAGLFLSAAKWLGPSAMDFNKLASAIAAAGGGTSSNVLI